MALRLIPFQFPGLDQVRCVFQMRGTGPDLGADFGLQGNVALNKVTDKAATIANRRELTRLPGVTGLADLYQVHGTRLIFEPPAQDVEILSETEADGLATRQSGLALLIKTADCQPLLLTDRQASFVAALHVGWRGNRLHFPQQAVAALCLRYNCPPREVLAVRGPSLGPTWSEFVNYASEWGAEFLPWYDQQSRTVNLWRLTRDQLLEAGLLPQNIFGLDLCTRTMHRDFFSYRYNHACGVQGSLIWRLPQTS